MTANEPIIRVLNADEIDIVSGGWINPDIQPKAPLWINPDPAPIHGPKVPSWTDPNLWLAR